MNAPASELLDIADGDPGRAELLRMSLLRLAAGPADSPLREMAQDVLAGRISLRRAVQIADYRDELRESLHQFQEWHDRAGPGEIEDAIARARQAQASMSPSD